MTAQPNDSTARPLSETLRCERDTHIWVNDAKRCQCGRQERPPMMTGVAAAKLVDGGGSTPARVESCFLHVELCPKRENGKAHCDHETGSKREGGRLVARTHTCCFCERRWVEEVKPLPTLPHIAYVAAKHGPFAPPEHLINGGDFDDR